MKLSELELTGAADTPQVYGVVVDRLGERPPQGLKEIGFIATCTSTDELSVDVLDTVILYRLHGVRVLLEIQAHLRMEAGTLVRTCANIGCDIVMMPPGSGTREDWDQYRQTLVAYTQAWLKVRGNQIAIYPSSGYLQYIFGASIGHKPERTVMTNDPYLRERFVDGLPHEEIALTKALLEPVLIDHFGGEEGIRTFMNTVGAGVFNKLRVVMSPPESSQNRP